MKNVLIIGAGGIGKRHIKGYLETKRVKVSIIEPDESKILHIKKNFSITKAFKNIEQANLTDFDLAVICSPANMHIEAMKICSYNKLSFMVEKPLSTNTKRPSANILEVRRGLWPLGMYMFSQSSEPSKPLKPMKNQHFRFSAPPSHLIRQK